MVERMERHFQLVGTAADKALTPLSGTTERTNCIGINNILREKCLFSLSINLVLQLVQRINSIYSAKRGKKRLKKLSMSNIETASLRGITLTSWAK